MKESFMLRVKQSPMFGNLEEEIHVLIQMRHIIYITTTNNWPSAIYYLHE